ncbi:MAG: hypothetical protein LBO78_00880 [Rickettsiales bacterium]|nr:hypothetical protein [Rickettsiales bacterium]
MKTIMIMTIGALFAAAGAQAKCSACESGYTLKDGACVASAAGVAKKGGRSAAR